MYSICVCLFVFIPFRGWLVSFEKKTKLFYLERGANKITLTCTAYIRPHTQVAMFYKMTRKNTLGPSAPCHVTDSFKRDKDIPLKVLVLRKKRVNVITDIDTRGSYEMHVLEGYSWVLVKKIMSTTKCAKTLNVCGINFISIKQQNWIQDSSNIQHFKNEVQHGKNYRSAVANLADTESKSYWIGIICCRLNFTSFSRQKWFQLSSF